MKIRAFIIDDEVSAIHILRGMLNEYFEDVIIVGQAVSFAQAINLLEQTDPDVVFLDILMPPWGSGFDLLQKIPDPNWGVVFTTAYPSYAIQAIQETQAWGYIVKPIRLSDLQLTMENVRSRLSRQPDVRRLIIPDQRRGNVIIRFSDILYCKAGGNTTEIVYLKEKNVQKVVYSRHLGNVEEDLSGPAFFRPHHSYIVNMAHIETYRQTGRNGEILLPYKRKVPISINKMGVFEEAFRAFSVLHAE
jgi:two-component system LytT family response regulator